MATSPIGAVTVDQLLRSNHFIQGVHSRIGATGNVFQSAYIPNRNMSTEPPLPPGFSTIGWDLFDNTRTVSEVRPELSGPARVIKKPIGHNTATLVRSYEAMLFETNRIAGFRPLGKPIGTLSPQGQEYVARQLKFLLQKQYNMREFMLNRMLRGGFDIKSQVGDRQILTEAGSGQISVDYQIPAANKTQLALGAAAANLITATWAAAGTDVIGQWLSIQQAQERQCGLPPEWAWITSIMLGYLINNTALRNAGGSAFRVWEMMQNRDMTTLDGLRQRGVDVIFRALPQVTFKTYDGVLNIEQDRDSLDIADCSLFIPNTAVIITPKPGEWMGQAVGQEYFIEQYGQNEVMKTATHNFARRELKPTPGTDVHVWSKSLPLLYIPKAVLYATTVF